MAALMDRKCWSTQRPNIATQAVPARRRVDMGRNDNGDAAPLQSSATSFSAVRSTHHWGPWIPSKKLRRPLHSFRDRQLGLLVTIEEWSPPSVHN